jgi:NAD(P)-dependent dehydrogenase (short-subunit alcohol dehydrogenase family)
MGRIALITGATRGIGFEIARQLSKRGLHVVVGARTPAAGEKSAAAIRGHGGTATVLPIDVSDSASIQAAAPAFSRVSEHLDVLVNNAGIYPDRDVSILTVSRDLLTTTFQTNTSGP